MRAALLLIAGLSGCDQVWGLERPDATISQDPNDEDNDGLVNTLDPCPHLANGSQVDDDHDGVPAICDADDGEDQTQVAFFSFDDPALSAALEVQGATTSDEPGTITFGQLGDGLSTITLKNVTAKTALVDIGFEILADTVEADPPTAVYAEIGIYTANTTYMIGSRGNVCFYGRLQGAPTEESLYTEVVENNGTHKTASAIGALVGSKGRMRVVRTPQTIDCSVVRTDAGMLGNADAVMTLQAVPGRIGISAERTVVRLRYLYIAYQPLTRL